MKTKEISLVLIATMLMQLLSFTAFAQTNTVTGWHADTSGIYVYFENTVTAADVQAGTKLTSNGLTVPFTVEERTMAANGINNSNASAYKGDTTIKIIPTGSKLTENAVYDLVINLSGAEVLNKYFKITELYFADFSEASQINDWWQNKQAWDLKWDETNQRMEVYRRADYAEEDVNRTLGIKKFTTNLEYRDYTVEFDLCRRAADGYPILRGLRWQDTAVTDSGNAVYPNTNHDWAKYHAFTNFYYDNGMRIKPNDGSKDTYISSFVPFPDFAGNNSDTKKIKELQNKQYHWTYAMQLGNKDLGVFVESDMTNGTVREFKMADVNIGLDGGGFSFDVNVRKPNQLYGFYLDNVHVTKVVEMEKSAPAIAFKTPSITYNQGNTAGEIASISGFVNISNTYSEAMPATVIMAAYDSATNRMKRATILHNANLTVGNNSIPISQPFGVSDANEVKVFVFKDLSSVVPYTQAQTINIEDGMGQSGKEALNGKKVLFVGCSYTYYGGTVCTASDGYNYIEHTQAERQNDEGFFYQLCNANGVDVNVTDWTYGGHNLKMIFDSTATCTKCNVTCHINDLVDKDYDYVILNEIKTTKETAEQIANRIQKYVDMFKSANEDVKIFYIVHDGVHIQNYDNEWLESLELIEDMGVTILDWGTLVYDVGTGVTQVPGGTLDYRLNSFMVSNSGDSYHPNLLTGYLFALMTYSAITGESAVGQPYDFCHDVNHENYPISSRYDVDYFVNNFYKYDNPDTAGDERLTNFPAIFGSPSDMEGLQKLVDEYLVPGNDAWKKYIEE